MPDNQGSSLNAAYDTASGYGQKGIAAVTGTIGNQVGHSVLPPGPAANGSQAIWHCRPGRSILYPTWNLKEGVKVHVWLRRA
jgi:hypothetical protein